MITTVRPSITRPRCPVFEPEDADYAAEVATFHTNTIPTPDLVAGAESSSDVVDALRFARELGLRASAPSGGHGIAPVTSGLMISMGRMNAVTIDAAARVATIGGGARWLDVLAAAEPHGLLPIIGSSSHVGLADYPLGGWARRTRRSSPKSPRRPPPRRWPRSNPGRCRKRTST